jgi:anaerobic magnesium-protoporphyrin IX monomethyl ester cyclase
MNHCDTEEIGTIPGKRRSNFDPLRSERHIMRIVLVNPPPYRIHESFYDTPPYPRAALAYLAGHLRSEGLDIGVLDCKYDRLSHDQAAAHIRQQAPDVVGFTAFTNEIVQAAKLAAMVKDWRPEVRTVIGGAHVTALPEDTLREFPQFDFGVVGEGEQSFLELLLDLDRGGRGDDIPGLCRHDGEVYHFGGNRPFISDIESLSVPAWDLFRPAREYFIMTSRGCPFHCTFCMNLNGHKVRTTSKDRVLREIEDLSVRFGAKRIHFADENFAIKRDRALEICRVMIDSGLNRRISWWCQNHVKFVDLELARMMKTAGCYEVGLGIESGNEANLKRMGKSTSIDDIRRAVADMKKARLPYNTFFILGFPNETKRTAMETINFAVKLNPHMPVFGIMVPYPGTEVGRMAAAGEGGYRLRTRNWNDYNKQLGDALSFEGISRKTLERLQIWGYLKVYLWNFRFGALARFIWRYRRVGWSVMVNQCNRLLKRD